jgi:DNA-directed RNA polymerase subunit RPC12/RpoP
MPVINDYLRLLLGQQTADAMADAAGTARNQSDLALQLSHSLRAPRYIAVVKTSKLSFACPVCHSRDVFYTCTPNCCFNHVCNECGATFEPVTKPAGGVRPGAEPPADTDASDPTVACATCDSIAVFMLPDGVLVCTHCGALLELEMTEIAPSQ